MNRPRPLILDISEHQLPTQLDYAQLAQAIDWVIVRVQYGSLHQDRHFQTHLAEFKRLKVPVNVYAWVRGISEADMIKEAEDFYQRASSFEPMFWWLDIEERSMWEMVNGCDCYRRRLKELGAQKVGAYIANHRYHEFGFSAHGTQVYEGLWLPTYGQNTGSYDGDNPTSAAGYDLHQYTSNGRLPGYNGPLDLSRLASNKPASYFTGSSVVKPAYQLGEIVQITGIYDSSTSTLQLRPLKAQGKITRIIQGVANPYLLDDGMGWVNEKVMFKQGTIDRHYVVTSGDTLWEIAQRLGVSWQTLARINQLADPNLIFPGQRLNY
ncbi:LysM peptidoglycan-binding domain-containing protein [uncultured Vagococcus sp.]|uniref:LysM peptidoglycan-binding domain-containing protein n=1 Tax=uncultured Vagococcus sp. TaxID=189676 RepID=UPI0028D2EFA4|nr:LysM peptidoglycan-binding domain-containing protein [uncultured Vagococcus sp.]